MLPPLHAIVTRLAPALPLLGLFLAEGVVKQPAAQSLITPQEARQLRDTRSLELRSITDPTGAARAAGTSQRELYRDEGGVYLSPDAARLERRLQELRRLEARDEAEEAPAPRQIPKDLPSSYDDAGAPLPSMRDPLRTAGRLLDRAESSIADGRLASARSDLASVEQQLARVEANLDESRADDFLSARDRLVALNARLTP